MMFPKPLPKLRRPWRAQRDDPVTPEMRTAILARDRACVATLVGWVHECRDQWGRAHAATVTPLLSIEHVYPARGFGLRRPKSDPEHLVALCHGQNGEHTPAELTRKLRTYLAWVNARGLERRQRIGGLGNRGREPFGPR